MWFIAKEKITSSDNKEKNFEGITERKRLCTWNFQILRMKQEEKLQMMLREEREKRLTMMADKIYPKWDIFPKKGIL